VGLAVVVGVAYPFHLIFERPGMSVNPARKKPQPESAGLVPARNNGEVAIGSAYAGHDSGCTEIRGLSASSN
jgi:hypothetical protein